MASIDLPDNDFRRAEWRLTSPTQINRSGWTGRSTVMSLPGAALWSVSAEHRPLIGEESVGAWRAFFARLDGQANSYRFPVTEQAQQAGSIIRAVAATNSSITFGANMTLNATRTVASKTGGGGTWNASVYSTTPLAAPLVLSFRPSTNTGEIVVGVRAGANAGDNYTEILRGFYMNGANQFQIIESGTTVGALRAISNGDVLSILIFGSVAYYCLNGSLLISTPTPQTPLYFDSSFAAVGASISDIGFGGLTSGLNSIRVSGMPSSATFLKAGSFLTLPSFQIQQQRADEQLVCLIADLVANSEGWGDATFSTPLRGQLTGGIRVESARPYAVVTLDEPSVGWAVDPGQIYQFALTGTETF